MTGDLIVPGRDLVVPNLSALPVGLTEDGSVWRLSVAGTHVLIVGATGSGKGSVQSSILGGLAPGVATHLVEVWLCDPKGMELAPWAPLAARYARPTINPETGEPDFEVLVRLLEDAARLMVARSDARFAAGQRKHTPRPGDPLIVLFLDELAFLTAYIDEGKERLKTRARRAISILLSQGRAPGIAVVANLQDPRKEVIPQRGLFPTTVCLRQTEAEMVDLILGKGARDRGARAEEIPEAMAGVGYVLLDGQREPTRVRASWWDDDDIAGCVATYAPLRPAAGIEVPEVAA